MNNAIAFKPVTTEDAALLGSVALRSYQAYYLHLWHDAGEWYMQNSFSTPQLVKEIADSNARFFMVFTGGKPVGFIKINLDAPLGDEPAALELERIYFIEEASGKGIGTRSVQYVISLAESLGKQTVWLKVMDTSPAISFYKKLGFEICGTHRLDFEQMKEEMRGMYVMKKTL